MKLKTRIFALVGGLFLSSFFISTVLEIFFSRQAAINTTQILENTLNDYETQRQQDVSSYLNDKIFTILATLKGTLDRTNRAEFWNYYFSPSDFNIATNHWLTSSLFLMSNKMLDLIQTEINEKLTSRIMLDQPPPYLVHVFDFLDDMKLCVVDPRIMNKPVLGPYIGIPYNYDVKVLPEVLGQTSGDQRGYNGGDVHYLMFSVDQVLNFDPVAYDSRINRFLTKDLYNPNTPIYPMNLIEINEMRKFLPQLKDQMVKLQNYLKANPGQLNYISQKKDAWIEDQFHNLRDAQTLGVEYNSLESVQVRFNQIAMVWQYTSFIATGASSYNIDDLAPIGLASLNRQVKIGPGIIASDILGDKPVELLSPSVYLAGDGRLFLGNQTYIDMKSSQGLRRTTLTVGVDMADLLRGLALVTRRRIVVVVNQKIVATADLRGNPEEVNPSDFPLTDILSATTGTFKNTKGVNYIFSTSKPFEDQNVYFVLYRLKSVEFGFIDVVAGGLNGLIRHLTLQNLIISILTIGIASLLISRLSLYITKPISLLATNSKEVQEGHLENVSLPPVEEGSEDEIEDLYHSFSDMVKGLKEKEKVKGILNKVVSPQIANKILEGNVTLGGEEKVVTVLFADIRHFTEMTEHLKPTELIQILNSYLTRLSEVIDRNNGVIDKYVGDEVMALFGAPVADKDSAYSAVKCALDMIAEVEKWNANRAKLGFKPIEIGIGIHTGNVVAGNVGAENRLNYTVLGANVNLASRLCAAATEKQILISQETLNSPHVKEIVTFHELEPINLKGFSKPVQIFEIQSNSG